MAARITELEALVERLPDDTREVFRRIFQVHTSVGHLVPPASMYRWIEEHFGSVEVVHTQQLVRVTNTVTWEGALFNELRARRPLEARADHNLADLLDEEGNDPFCRPLESTPADVFGRVRGQHAITASNIAKYDVHQALGLGFRWRDVRVMSYLTPVKDRETLLVASRVSEDLKRAVYRVLQTFEVSERRSSFNVALYMPPFTDTGEEWHHFPVIFRIVSRGDPMYLTTDVGAMELYAVPVIGIDPFVVAGQLRAAFA